MAQRMTTVYAAMKHGKSLPAKLSRSESTAEQIRLANKLIGSRES